MSNPRTFCVPTQEGCSKCQGLPALPYPAATALLLAPTDNDANKTLSSLLDSLFIIANARPQLSLLTNLFRSELLSCTQSAIRGAYIPQLGESGDTLLKALIHAEPLSEVLETLQYEWVRDVLENGWLTSVFHAIVDIETGRPYAYEALLRAKMPDTTELIGAPRLIHACEKLELQHQLDQRARCSAIRCASELNLAEAHIFINFLPNTIYDPKICLRTTMEAAEQYGIPLSRLVLEVVETEEIKDMARLNRILDYYRDRGIGTAVDDMGAGFTSMEYLLALRPDYVKMDRDVVREAEHNPQTRHSFEATVRLAKELGCKIIAEGIETLSQAELCRSIGVNYLQGFLFSRPANPPQALAYDLSTPLRAAA